MEEKTCKGCKREESKSDLVTLNFCRHCTRIQKNEKKRNTDYYERKVK